MSLISKEMSGVESVVEMGREEEMRMTEKVMENLEIC